MALGWLSKLFTGGGSMQALETGALAPRFTLKDADGKTHSLAEALQRGPVLLAFFKESCPVCQFTFPFLERIHQGLNGTGNARVWGISQDDARDTRDFAREQGCTFPLLLDQEGYTVSNQYGLTNVPTLFLIQPDGKIQVSAVGFERKALETAAAAFGQLAGQPITVFQPTDAVPEYTPG